MNAKEVRESMRIRQQYARRLHEQARRKHWQVIRQRWLGWSSLAVATAFMLAAVALQVETTGIVGIVFATGAGLIATYGGV